MTTQEIAAPGWNITGHEHAVDILRRTLAAQQVRHAYLFTGPQHIGKSLLARRFAQTLLCTGGADPTIAPDVPCNHCLSCRKVLHGNHPDVHIIAKASDKQFIIIEQIRALQNDSARHTLEGRRNIFIIENAQDMNAQSANCILKTLEEPEPDVILLLTVPDAGLLLPTIVSRVQLVPMQLLTNLHIKNALMQQWGVEPKEAELIAALAAGRMGWAIQAAENDDILTQRHEQLESLAAGRMGWAIQAVENDDILTQRREQLESLTKLLSMSRVQRFDFVQKLGTDSEKVQTLLELWLLWWRDMVLAANGCLDLTVNVDMRSQLKAQAAKLGTAEAERMIRRIIETMEAIAQNVNTRVALEVLMLDLPHL